MENDRIDDILSAAKAALDDRRWHESKMDHCKKMCDEWLARYEKHLDASREAHGRLDGYLEGLCKLKGGYYVSGTSA